jgi:lysophospholipase L1-like esterase
VTDPLPKLGTDLVVAGGEAFDDQVFRVWRRYVALGDSFTEGLMDDPRPDGRHLGWADRLAEELGRRAPGGEGIEYANLAVRGRLIAQVVTEQVPAALALAPDLVSLAVGVNDTLRPHFDVNAAATALESGVRDLRASGADVLLFAFGDPTRRSRAMGIVRDRIRAYNSAVRAIAAHYDCRLVDFWQVAAFDDPALWDEDWLHLSPEGHQLVVACALEALALGDDAWRTPGVVGPPAPLPGRAAANARWVHRHLLPWVARRLRGETSGDSVRPKDPEYVRVGSVGLDRQAN